MFNLLGENFLEYKYHILGSKPPDNLNADVVGIRSLIPSTYVSQPRPFLFVDESPYASGYDMTHTIHLD